LSLAGHAPSRGYGIGADVVEMIAGRSARGTQA